MLASNSKTVSVSNEYSNTVCKNDEKLKMRIQGVTYYILKQKWPFKVPNKLFYCCNFQCRNIS